jgi:hypothetical protein
MEFSSFLIFATSNLHLLNDLFFKAIAVGRLMGFLPLERIQFLVILIGQHIPSVMYSRQIRQKHDFILFVVFLNKFMKYWETL